MIAHNLIVFLLPSTSTLKSQRRTLRPREVRESAQGRTASPCKSEDSNPGLQAQTPVAHCYTPLPLAQDCQKGIPEAWVEKCLIWVSENTLNAASPAALLIMRFKLPLKQIIFYYTNNT